MKFLPEIRDYLDGKSFIGSLHVKLIGDKGKPKKRIEYLERISKNKKVLHLGCVDHLPMVDVKILDNIWLHSLLCNSSSRCLGIDINNEGIEYIKKLGYNDCITYDITSKVLSKEILSERWDYLIMGEILEHVDNPVAFLQSIRENYKNNIENIIITVPNGIRLINFKNVLKGKEVINSDHRYWFTPYTLAKIATNAGYQVKEFTFLLDYKMFKYSVLTKIIYRFYPAFLDNLCMIIKL